MLGRRRKIKNWLPFRGIKRLLRTHLAIDIDIRISAMMRSMLANTVDMRLDELLLLWMAWYQFVFSFFLLCFENSEMLAPRQMLKFRDARKYLCSCICMRVSDCSLAITAATCKYWSTYVAITVYLHGYRFWFVRARYAALIALKDFTQTAIILIIRFWINTWMSIVLPLFGL